MVDKHEMAARMVAKQHEAEEQTAVALTRFLQADGLPGVLVTTQRPWRDIADEALRHLARSRARIYLRDQHLVRIQRSDEDAPFIEPLSETALKGILARTMNFVKILPRDRTLHHVPPPDTVVKDILERERDRWPFPVLEAIVEFPVFRPDGTLLDRPGYDPATRLVYIPSRTLQMPPIAEQPSWEDIVAAVTLIEETIGEFPFQDDASHANAVALMLTPLIRQAINGHVPAALIDATRPGTGKSLLAEIIALTATGRKGAMMPAPYDDDEWRKRIAATLADGPTIIVIDNLRTGSVLKSAALDLALTSHYVSERILGQSKNALLPQRATWMITGNNIQVGGDMPRRCYWIRMDAKMARPATRGGFKHDLETWVPAHRGELIAALLTLARAWYAAGKPAALLPKMGSFQAWVDTVGGILAYTECYRAFLGNLEAFQEQADDEAMQWASFLHAWHTTYGDKELLVADIEKDLKAGALDNAMTGVALSNALPDDLSDLHRGNFKRRLGKALSARVGSQFDESGLHLVKGRADSRSGAVYWKVAGVQQNETEILFKEVFGTPSPPPLESLGSGVEGGISSDAVVGEQENTPAKPAHLQRSQDDQVQPWHEFTLFAYVSTPQGCGAVVAAEPHRVDVLLDETARVVSFEHYQDIRAIRPVAMPQRWDTWLAACQGMDLDALPPGAPRTEEPEIVPLDRAQLQRRLSVERLRDADRVSTPLGPGSLRGVDLEKVMVRLDRSGQTVIFDQSKDIACIRPLIAEEEASRNEQT